MQRELREQEGPRVSVGLLVDTNPQIVEGQGHGPKRDKRTRGSGVLGEFLR